MKKTLPFIIVFVIFLIAVPFVVKAECPPCPHGVNGVICIPDPLKCKGITGVIDAITDLLKFIAIPLGTIMIIISGIQYMTSAGNEEKATKAKKTMLYTVIGVAIVIAVDFIVGLVTEILGAE